MYYETFHTETIDGVTYTLEATQDDVPVRGNASAMGDDELDQEIEDGIIARLDDGDVWAWASVRVTAHVDIALTDEQEVLFQGEQYIGGCNYTNAEDFMANGPYDDLKSEALDDLKRSLERAVKVATRTLTALECKIGSL